MYEHTSDSQFAFIIISTEAVGALTYANHHVQVISLNEYRRSSQRLLLEV